jgi:HlyD family secretion protein
MNSEDRWVRIYVREDQVGRVHIGQSVAITSDSHPRKTYRGRVTFIASEAEFTPRNVQTAEERSKLVYRIRISVDNKEGILKQGMPVEAEIILK